MGSDHSVRVRSPGLQIKGISTHIVPSVARQLHAVLLLLRLRPRLRELPRHSSHPNNGHLATEHQDSAHLTDDPESVPNVELLEAFGAVLALEKESISQGLAQAFLQVPGLSAEHNRRQRIQRLENRVQLRQIRVLREVERFPRSWGE